MESESLANRVYNDYDDKYNYSKENNLKETNSNNLVFNISKNIQNKIHEIRLNKKNSKINNNLDNIEDEINLNYYLKNEQNRNKPIKNNDTNPIFKNDFNKMNDENDFYDNNTINSEKSFLVKKSNKNISGNNDVIVYEDDDFKDKYISSKKINSKITNSSEKILNYTNMTSYSKKLQNLQDNFMQNENCEKSNYRNEKMNYDRVIKTVERKISSDKIHESIVYPKTPNKARFSDKNNFSISRRDILIDDQLNFKIQSKNQSNKSKNILNETKDFLTNVKMEENSFLRNKKKENIFDAYKDVLSKESNRFNYLNEKKNIDHFDEYKNKIRSKSTTSVKQIETISTISYSKKNDFHNLSNNNQMLRNNSNSNLNNNRNTNDSFNKLKKMISEIENTNNNHLKKKMINPIQSTSDITPITLNVYKDILKTTSNYNVCNTFRDKVSTNNIKNSSKLSNQSKLDLNIHSKQNQPVLITNTNAKKNIDELTNYIEQTDRTKIEKRTNSYFDKSYLLNTQKEEVVFKKNDALKEKTSSTYFKYTLENIKNENKYNKDSSLYVKTFSEFIKK